jgi:regulator of extracellular matrix RemA (YlzA/DUF370 family)
MEDKIINIELTNIKTSDRVANLFATNPEDLKDILSAFTIITEGVSYSELLSELTNQPYILDKMSVYADTSEQVTQKLTKIKRTSNGISKTEVEYPKLNPNQFQFVLENIKLDFIPSPISKLQYRVKANQTVNLWFYYRNIDATTMLTENKKELLLETPINKNIKQSSMRIEKTNPLISIIKPKKRTIKEIVKSNSKLRDITQISDEEVFNAFDETDFTK